MEKKVFRMYELSGSDACNARRSFDFAVKEKESDIFQKAVVTKTIIHDYFDGKLLLPDLEDEVREKMKNVSFLSEEQREVQMMDTLRQIQRYIMSEKRTPTVAPPADIDVSDEMTVIVSPDYYFINTAVTKEGEEDNELEVIKIKCSKPGLTSTQANQDIGLYAMLRYAKELQEAKRFPNVKRLKASYYYLGKANDSYSTEKPNFDPDFFNNVGGKNIVSLTDDVNPGFSDARFAPILDGFLAGIPSEECTKDDCDHCQLHDICKFTEPPIILVKEEKAKSLNGLMLTPSQQKAIEYQKGICRINAGAGAGKTAVIALRVANLLTMGVKPEEICLVTFTNAGAEEMRTRIQAYIADFGFEESEAKDMAKAMTIQTFNAFGDDIIKKDYAKVGFSEPPTVIDDTERSIIIARIINEAVAEPRYNASGRKIPNPLKKLNWRAFTANSKYAKGAITVAKKVFDIMKVNNYTAADLPDIAKDLGADYSRFIGDQQCLLELAVLYDKYDEELRAENLIEFADQQVLVFELLHDDPYYFERFGFKHIIVDEFQDSDAKQVEMIRLLSECPTFESLMVVGDDSQSIYAFRGTTNDFIINFDTYMGQTIDDIYLLENHRSTPEIIEFANKINSNNIHRVIKDLVATRPHGKPVVVQGFLTPAEERKFVIDSIKEHLDAGVKPEDIAIECYTKYELLEMANLLQAEGIPSVMLNPEALVENSRVRATVALVNALYDASDTKDMLVYANAAIGGGVLSMSEEAIQEELEKTADLITTYHSMPTEEEKKQYLFALFERINYNEDEIYSEFLKKLAFKPLPKILEYIHEFYLYGSDSAIKRTHTYPGIVLTTAHSSKGLEWPVVYNMISKYDGSELPKNTASIEERRRLLFVSATRARDELYVTGQYVAYGKKGDYQYNRFLIESYHAVGMEFNVSSIEAERAVRDAAAKEARAKAKEEARKKMEALIASMRTA